MTALSINPDSGAIRFPIDLNPENDVFLSTNRHQILASSRIQSIAAALLAKRNHIIRKRSKKNSLASLPGHPEATLFITADELGQHEKPSLAGQKISDVMKELCDKPKHKTASNKMRKLLEDLTDNILKPAISHHELHICDHYLAVTDISERRYPLKVGNRSYDVLIPRGQKPGGGKSWGLSNKLLERIAAAGTNGIAAEKLQRNSSLASIRVMKSQANRHLAELGFQNLWISCRNGKLYFHDSLQEPGLNEPPRSRAATAHVIRIEQRALSNAGRDFSPAP